VINIKNIVHEENKLYIIFDYIDYDLKKYLDINKAPLS